MNACAEQRGRKNSPLATTRSITRSKTFFAAKRDTKCADDNGPCKSKIKAREAGIQASDPTTTNVKNDDESTKADVMYAWHATIAT